MSLTTARGGGAGGGGGFEGGGLGSTGRAGGGDGSSGGVRGGGREPRYLGAGGGGPWLTTTVLVHAAISSSAPATKTVVPLRMAKAPLEDGLKCSIGTDEEGGGGAHRDDAGAWRAAAVPGAAPRAPTCVSGIARSAGAVRGSRGVGARGSGAGGGWGCRPRGTARRVGRLGDDRDAGAAASQSARGDRGDGAARAVPTQDHGAGRVRAGPRRGARAGGGRRAARDGGGTHRRGDGLECVLVGGR